MKKRHKPKPSPCSCLCCQLYAEHPDRSELCKDAAYIYNTDHNELPAPQQRQLGEYVEFRQAITSPPGKTVYFITNEAADIVSTALLDDMAQISGSFWTPMWCDNLLDR